MAHLRVRSNLERATWWVYLLRCSDGSLYCGITTDLGRRVKQHNNGTASKYTRSRLPVRLAISMPEPDRASALRFEARIKAMTRRQKERLVEVMA